MDVARDNRAVVLGVDVAERVGGRAGNGRLDVGREARGRPLVDGAVLQDGRGQADGDVEILIRRTVGVGRGCREDEGLANVVRVGREEQATILECVLALGGRRPGLDGDVGGDQRIVDGFGVLYHESDLESLPEKHCLVVYGRERRRRTGKALGGGGGENGREEGDETESGTGAGVHGKRAWWRARAPHAHSSANRTFMWFRRECKIRTM